MAIDDIKKELASILNAVKTRIEMEKGFGIDTLTLSKPVHRIQFTFSKVVHKKKAY